MAASHEGNSLAECERDMCQEQVPLPGAKTIAIKYERHGYVHSDLKPVERETTTRSPLKNTLAAYAPECPSHRDFKQG